MKILAQIGAALSVFFCLLGGLWILLRTNVGSKENVLTTAVGFYFIGKAFYTGPTLILAANKRRFRKERREPITDAANDGNLY